MTAESRVHWGVSAAFVAVFLAPLLTMKMPFRVSLVFQAVVLLGATAQRWTGVTRWTATGVTGRVRAD